MPGLIENEISAAVLIPCYNEEQSIADVAPLSRRPDAAAHV
jgi:hypothetical protein